MRSTRKTHTDGHERGGNENAHALAEGRDIWGRKRRIEEAARSSPVSHQGESWVVGMVGARMEAGVQRLMLDAIRIPLQQGLEAGMGANKVSEGGNLVVIGT